jgi:gluconokinase
MVIVLMGVAGCGKTAVGQELARRLGWPFYDGDDYHSEASRASMAAGRPLADEDRWPWLARLRQLIEERLAAGQSAVLACSALKKSYRDRLRGDSPAVRFVYLAGDPALIRARLEARPGHYMKPAMLASQLATLEPPGPGEALMLAINDDVAAIVAAIICALGLAAG